MHTRVMYHALHESGLSNLYIIQDVAIPYPKAEEFMNYLDSTFKNYPIWLCPLKQSGKNIASTHSLQADKTKHKLPEMMLNFGVWGPGPTRRKEFVAWNRMFEQKVHELGGQKWLYAHTYYTKEEFNEIYNNDAYLALREKYYATHLPTVYDKVKVDVEREEKSLQESWALWLLALFWSIWPLAGLFGVYKTIRGGDYLLAKNSKGTKLA
jgi:delta24-sterol reductase